MRRSSLLLTLYVVFYFVYLITGGVVFAAVEAPEENAIRSTLVTARRIFLENHPCVTGRSEIVVSEFPVELLWDMSCVRRLTRPASSATMLYSLQSRILPIRFTECCLFGCIYGRHSHTEGNVRVVTVLS
jgi:hypothetical protein